MSRKRGGGGQESPARRAGGEEPDSPGGPGAAPDLDYRELDELIHSRIRLGAMAILAAAEDAEFTYLRDRLGATDGNLSTHMRRLEEAGYVEVRKEFVDRKPVTRYRLTGRGRQAFAAYLERLERILETARDQEEQP